LPDEFVFIKPVCEQDQIQHGCVANFVSFAAENAASQPIIATTGTDVNVSSREDRRSYIGLAEGYIRQKNYTNVNWQIPSHSGERITKIRRERKSVL
jgi:hypothetical protein